MVASAGNIGGLDPDVVKDSTPQDLADSKKALIIVGAIDENGQVWTKTAKDPTGLITVWAPSVNIPIRSMGNKLPPEDSWSGTSHAAAIVVRTISVFSEQP